MPFGPLDADLDPSKKKEKERAFRKSFERNSALWWQIEIRPSDQDSAVNYTAKRW